MPRFDGKVALITGGGTGIGFACARSIVDGGGSVMLAGRRQDVVQAAAQQLGARAAAVACDITADASVEAAIAATVDRFGALQLAVNSAGMPGTGSVLNALPAEVAMVVDTNVVGTFRCVRAEAQAMQRAGGGAIVNISSIAAALTHRWMTSYCVSKAAVNMLTACAADDLGAYGIRVNAVMPGLVPTDMAAPLVDAPASVAEYLRLMPIRRLGTPGDVGALVAFLLSDDAGWITGQCIPVDGGHTLRSGPDLVPFIKQFLPAER